MHTHLVPLIQPGNLEVTYNCPTSAEISWTPIPIEQRNGFITGYALQVLHGQLDTPSQKVLRDGEDPNSIEISNLKPFTEYIFKVSAETKVGTGPAASASYRTPEAGET